MGCCGGTTSVTSADVQTIQELLGRQPVEHTFDKDGWNGFEPVVISAHGSQQFVTSVDAQGRGVVTGVGAGNGSLRVAYVRENTDFADQEITSVIWGPTANWDGSNAQQGHIHHVRQIGPSLWEGIAVWTSIVFGGDYSFLHVAGVRWDGITLWMSNVTGGTFGANDLSYINRVCRVMGHERFNFLGWLNQFTLMHPEWLQYLAVGNMVSISNLGDATFNDPGVAIASPVGATTGLVTVTEPTTTSASPFVATGGGELAPVGVHLQKRYTPTVMSTRVIQATAGSAIVEGKRWRLGEGEPDWANARVQRATVTPSVDVPAIATRGDAALWAAHFHDGSGGAWGDIKVRCVAQEGCPT